MTPNTAVAPVSGEEELSQSFVYLVSARGANSFWARLLNGCDKNPTSDVQTLAVSVSPKGRFVLHYNPEFVKSISARMLKIVLVHEAGHIALRHHERLFRILAQVENDPALKNAVSTVFNIAADFAVNDAIVRHEAEFPAAQQDHEWMGLLPETAKPALPKNLSFEEYVLKILPDAEELAQQMQKLCDQLKNALDDAGDDDGDEGGNSGQEGQGESGSRESDSDASGKTGSNGKGRGNGKKGKQKGPATFSDDPDDTVTDDMRELAKNAELVKTLAEKFKELSGGAHETWLDKASEMTPDEATDIANKLKRHAQRLARNAWDQTIKARGFVPGHIQGLVKPLLDDEQVPWHWFFNDAVQAQISTKVIEAMAQPNAALINDGFVEPWPGYALDTEFNVGFLIDTSGSMSDVEFARACAVFNSMMAQDKRIRCRLWHCDAAIQYEGDVDNIQPADTSTDQQRHGYGGTVYSPVFRRILGLDRVNDWARADVERCDEPTKKLDLLIVYTDGYVGIEHEVLPQLHPGCPIIWLVAPGCKPARGMNNTPPDFVIQMFHLDEQE